MVVSILIILLISFLVFYVPYMSKTVVSDNKKIRPDATIINISHEKVKHGRSRYIKTIVEFSDGVEYHTYETRYEPRLGYTQIIVDNDVVEKIKDKAIKEHRKLEAKHPYNPAANPLFCPGRITLSEKTLAEFNDYPEDFLKVVCNWIVGWRREHTTTNRYSTLDFLRALESCGKGRQKENALQICQSIYDEKLPIEKDDIDHMMKQLTEVLRCADKETLPQLEDKVIVGLEGILLYEILTSSKYR